jgi:hypothetical protein
MTEKNEEQGMDDLAEILKDQNRLEGNLLRPREEIPEFRPGKKPRLKPERLLELIAERKEKMAEEKTRNRQKKRKPSAAEPSPPAGRIGRLERI